jgi:hypothetical protein
MKREKHLKNIQQFEDFNRLKAIQSFEGYSIV